MRSQLLKSDLSLIQTLVEIKSLCLAAKWRVFGINQDLTNIDNWYAIDLTKIWSKIVHNYDRNISNDKL